MIRTRSLVIFMTSLTLCGSALAADNRLKIYERYLSEMNAGNAEAAVSEFSDKVKFIGGGPPCTASTPCFDKKSIRQYVDTMMGAHFKGRIVGRKPSASPGVARVEVVNDIVTQNGVSRIVGDVDTKVENGLMTQFTFRPDMKDAETARLYKLVAQPVK